MLAKQTATPKLSVIMAVYNSESFLERAVESVLAQTFRDFELVVVNDGSTDGSGGLCEALAQRDDRIRVVSQQNKGLSGAWESGVRNAHGDYLCIVDSDDFILPRLFEQLLSAQTESGADIVRGGAVVLDEAEVPDPLPLEYDEYQSICRKRLSYAGGVFDTRSFMEDFFESDRWYSIWSSVFKRSIIKTQYFEPGRRKAVDLVFWMNLFEEEPELTIRTVPYCGYVYIRRKGSVSAPQKQGQKTAPVRKTLMNLELRKRVIDFLSKKGYISSYKRAVLSLVNMGMSKRADVSKRGGLGTDFCREYFRIINENKQAVYKNRELSVLYKLGFWLFVSSPWMYYALKTLRSRISGRE